MRNRILRWDISFTILSSSVDGAAATAGAAGGADSGGLSGFKILTRCSDAAATRSAGSMGATP
jgi:hypothetical protein